MLLERAEVRKKKKKEEDGTDPKSRRREAKKRSGTRGTHLTRPRGYYGQHTTHYITDLHESTVASGVLLNPHVSSVTIRACRVSTFRKCHLPLQSVDFRRVHRRRSVKGGRRGERSGKPVAVGRCRWRALLSVSFSLSLSLSFCLSVWLSLSFSLPLVSHSLSSAFYSSLFLFFSLFFFHCAFTSRTSRFFSFLFGFLTFPSQGLFFESVLFLFFFSSRFVPSRKPPAPSRAQVRRRSAAAKSIGRDQARRDVSARDGKEKESARAPRERKRKKEESRSRCRRKRRRRPGAVAGAGRGKPSDGGGGGRLG